MVVLPLTFHNFCTSGCNLKSADCSIDMNLKDDVENDLIIWSMSLSSCISCDSLTDEEAWAL